jgi:hypothetical protein
MNFGRYFPFVERLFRTAVAWRDRGDGVQEYKRFVDGE